MESLMQKQSTPFQFDFHGADVSQTLVFGRVGGEPRSNGSAFLIASLASQRGTKVFVYDKDESADGFMRKIARLEKKVSRMRRYGSRWEKVLVKRNGHLTLEEVVSAVKQARRH